MKFYLDPAFAAEDIAPVQATAGSCAFDLKAATNIPLIAEYGKFTEVNTGVKIACPEGVAALLIPRSSSRKSNLVLANTIGLIDTDYRGYIICSVSSRYPDRVVTIEPYERIAQLLLVMQPDLRLHRVMSPEELGSTQRGEGGHGHTGR